MTAPEQGPWAVTGANGFIGAGLCARLAGEGIPLRPLARRRLPDLIAGAAPVTVPGYEYAALAAALEGVEVVVHLAGGAHGRNRETDEAGLAENVLKAAATAGARRFVYVSSIKAQSGARADEVLTEDTPPAPDAPYGRAKRAAERAIADTALALNLDWTIVRPTLVYGPGAKGHLAALMSWLYQGRPLPFGRIRNRRSMVSLNALCALLFACGRRPEAAGEYFIAADPGPVSTAGLALALKAGLRVSTPVWPVPPALLSAALSLTGRGAWRDRLLGDLEASAAKAHRLLGWQGEAEPETALAATARDWVMHHPGRETG